jgi:predicted nuclease of predicted toxin-antitoxin system
MRILLDHNVPVPLRHWLVDHEVETAYERGWSELSNGDLLRAAEDAGVDVLITTDKRIRYQQNLSGRRMALVVIDTNDWTRIRKSQSAVVDALSDVRPGAFIEVAIPFAE